MSFFGGGMYPVRDIQSDQLVLAKMLHKNYVNALNYHNNKSDAQKLSHSVSIKKQVSQY